MSELHKFLFEGMPVRGMLVRITDGWQEVLRRRAASGEQPPELRELLGQMAAASLLMQANIKFNGSLVLQVFGDGPVKLAVAEAQPDLSFRVMAKQVGEIAPGARLPDMLNIHGQGRCAITLDARDRAPGQQPYQGVVPLNGPHRERLATLSEVLEQYMLMSEQLDTRIVLAANDTMAAGLLIQRLPVKGEQNIEASAAEGHEDQIGGSEDYNRVAMHAATLTKEELLTLDADTILRRLFWEEKVQRFEPMTGELGPRFACTCSRERVGQMLKGLGREEVDSVLAERGDVEIGCEFCGLKYEFDAVDVAALFHESPTHEASSQRM
ncbi:MAG: Hsp33 family molecular chaperone HslO [Paucibacter sp.]|nr:Hsp33 family molecular chaperone HslO [Roseateles sp.]